VIRRPTALPAAESAVAFAAAAADPAALLRTDAPGLVEKGAPPREDRQRVSRGAEVRPVLA
jgi:hypothetical protein